MQDAPFFVDGALGALEDSTLFYPCAGRDWATPIRLFCPLVTQYWFVDTEYFRPTSPADQQPTVLGGDSDFELLETSILGPVAASIEQKTDESGEAYPFLEPCLRRETYVHRPTSKRIEVNRRRGFGFTSFKKVVKSIGVFFYRGDSDGESGSGNLWLNRDHLSDVCDKLINGGLLVTDASNKPMRWLRKARSEAIDVGPRAFINSGRGYLKLGRRFKCVGYVGEKYGPTLAWRVTREG